MGMDDKMGKPVEYIGHPDALHQRINMSDKVGKNQGIITDFHGVHVGVTFVDGKKLWIHWTDLKITE